MSLRLFGWARVSSDEQASTGHSMDAQPKRLKAYCELYGYELVEIIEDPASSAFKTSFHRRAAGREMLARIRAGEADGFVVTRLDRAFRRMADAEELIPELRRGDMSLHSIAERVDTSTAAGRFNFRILVAHAEYDSDLKSERNSDISEYLREQGRAYGPTPYGFDKIDGQLIANPETWATRCLIVSMRDGGMTYQRIGDALKGQGVTPPRGKGRCWSKATLRNICETHHGLEHIAGARQLPDAPASQTSISSSP